MKIKENDLYIDVLGLSSPEQDWVILNDSGWKDYTLDYTMLRFQRSLQALASPAEVQLDLFPDFLWKVDVMAIEFDQWYQNIMRRSYLFTKKQKSLLEELNSLLDEISGPENSDLWLEESLRTNAIWEKIRILAQSALKALGWSIDKSQKQQINV